MFFFMFLFMTFYQKDNAKRQCKDEKPEKFLYLILLMSFLIA